MAQGGSNEKKYNVLFWVLVGCTIVTVIVTLFMMYRMSQKPKIPMLAPPPHPTMTGAMIDRFEDTTEIVYIYSDGCGWCDRFNPVWQDFADRYSGPVTVRKVEAKSDDAKTYIVSGYPTVLLMQNGAQKAVFSDDRTVENLMKFAQTA